MEARHCRRIATTLQTAEEALLKDLEPTDEVNEELTDAVAVFVEMRMVFVTLARKAESGKGGQAFQAVKNALAGCDLPQAASEGTVTITSPATAQGLHKIIETRQYQLDQIVERFCDEADSTKSTNVARSGTAVTMRRLSRELELLVQARDIITGG